MATLLAERSPEQFRSAFAACGQIGNFRLQINYVGNFRVLFDYFFPGLIPGSPIAIPSDVMADWYTVYVPAITSGAGRESRAGARTDARRARRVRPGQSRHVINTAISLLWYNVFGTNDAVRKLGGNPFGNRLTWYFDRRTTFGSTCRCAG